jgi:hypothetical protein
VLVCNSFFLEAQIIPIVKYCDSFWLPTAQENAFYICHFVKVDTFFTCTSYDAVSKKLVGISNYTDTMFSKCIGLFRKYYENGQLRDSSFYDNETGVMYSSIQYFKSGHLMGHYELDRQTGKVINEGFNENGGPIKNFIYFRQAQFKGGGTAWSDYLGRHIKSKIPVQNGAPRGSYQVIVRLMIEKDGHIKDVIPLTNFGFGMEEEVVRVVKSVPNWTPRIFLNKNDFIILRQPITFVVQEK